MHKDGRRWVGSNKVVELKKKKKNEVGVGRMNHSPHHSWFQGPKKNSLPPTSATQSKFPLPSVSTSC